MLAPLARPDQVDHTAAPGHQPVRDMRAVALGGIGLGAHDAGAVGQSGRSALELGSFHVLRVAAPAHPAQGVAPPAIFDLMRGEKCGEPLPREMRVPAGNGVGADIHQQADVRVVQDCEEILGAARAVAEREDQAAFACSFLPSFFSFFSVFFLASVPAASAPSSARSIRLTSARGALSPLRKPVLRMRMYPPGRLA